MKENRRVVKERIPPRINAPGLNPDSIFQPSPARSQNCWLRILTENSKNDQKSNPTNPLNNHSPPFQKPHSSRKNYRFRNRAKEFRRVIEERIPPRINAFGLNSDTFFNPSQPNHNFFLLRILIKNSKNNQGSNPNNPLNNHPPPFQKPHHSRKNHRFRTVKKIRKMVEKQIPPRINASALNPGPHFQPSPARPQIVCCGF